MYTFSWVRKGILTCVDSATWMWIPSKTLTTRLFHLQSLQYHQSRRMCASPWPISDVKSCFWSKIYMYDDATYSTSVCPWPLASYLCEFTPSSSLDVLWTVRGHSDSKMFSARTLLRNRHLTTIVITRFQEQRTSTRHRAGVGKVGRLTSSSRNSFILKCPKSQI